MRTAMLMLLVVAFASTAYATNPNQFRTTEAVKAPEITRDIFYCNGNPHPYLWVINAETPFGSELADDLPADFECTWISDVVVIVAEWGGYWIDPAGVIVNFYYEGCPPELDPAQTHYIPWGDPVFMPPEEMVLVYDDPGWFTAWEIVIYICPLKHIGDHWSIGFIVDTYWGATAPYAGVVMTNDYEWYGCSEAYWDGTYWGVQRWTPVSGYFGTPADIYFCLSTGQGPSGTDSESWSSIKALYK